MRICTKCQESIYGGTGHDPDCEGMFMTVINRGNKYFVKMPDRPENPEFEITLPAVIDLAGHLRRYEEDFINEQRFIGEA